MNGPRDRERPEARSMRRVDEEFQKSWFEEGDVLNSEMRDGEKFQYECTIGEKLSVISTVNLNVHPTHAE